MKTIMKVQKITGMVLLLLSAALIFFSVKFEEGDITFAMMSIPLGFWLLFSKKRLLDMDQDDEEFFK